MFQKSLIKHFAPLYPNLHVERFRFVRLQYNLKDKCNELTSSTNRVTFMNLLVACKYFLLCEILTNAQ